VVIVISVVTDSTACFWDLHSFPGNQWIHSHCVPYIWIYMCMCVYIYIYIFPELADLVVSFLKKLHTDFLVPGLIYVTNTSVSGFIFLHILKNPGCLCPHEYTMISFLDFFNSLWSW
jgi:hypothetical protein